MDYIKIRFVDDQEGLESEFRRTVEELMHAVQPRFAIYRQRWQPLIDIYETRGEIVILAEIAGVEGGTVNLEIGARAVKISGTREGRSPEDDARYRLAEIQYGYFERTISLPVPINTETAKAVYRNGLLEIRLSKRPVDRIHKINIKGS